MPHIFVTIKELEESFASRDELDIRDAFESAINCAQIGTITGSGSGFGEMDISLIVTDAKAAIAELEKIAGELDILSRITIEESEERKVEDEDRTFLSRLGPEVGPEHCRCDSCEHLRIMNSVFCQIHHFRQVFGRLPSSDSVD